MEVLSLTIIKYLLTNYDDTYLNTVFKFKLIGENKLNFSHIIYKRILHYVKFFCVLKYKIVLIIYYKFAHSLRIMNVRGI